MFGALGEVPAVDILLTTVVEVSDGLALRVDEAIVSVVGKVRGRHCVWLEERRWIC